MVLPHRAELDGLRAVAIVSVLLFHLREGWLPSGYLGVDLFFVISGYVVTRSLWGVDLRAPNALLSFYARRVKRLLPALVVSVCVTALAAALVSQRPRASLRTAKSALLGVSNIDLWRHHHDYFAVAPVANALLHTWSLGVEAQFYVVVPLLVWASTRAVRRGSRSLALIGMASFVAYLSVYVIDPTAAFYLMPTRAWQLVLGAWVFVATADRPHDTTSLARRMQLPFTLASLVVLAWPRTVGPWLTVIGTITFAGWLWSLEAPGRVHRWLQHPAPVELGRCSYALYLWHWGGVAVAIPILGAERPPLVILPAIMALAWVTYRGIERPLRVRRWFVEESRYPYKVLLAGMMASIACVGFLYGVPRWTDRGFAPFPEEASFLVHDACHSPKDRAHTRCLSVEGDGPAIYLAGDSHAGNLSVGLRALAAKRGLRFAHLTGEGLVPRLSRAERSGERVYFHEDEVGEWLRVLVPRLQPGDTVVFSMTRDRLYVPDFHIPNPPVVQAFELNLTRFARGVTTTGARVLLVEDIPKLCTAAAFTVARVHPERCQIEESRSLEHRKPLSEVYRRVASKLPNVERIDPHPSLCEDGQCSNFLGGELLYVDDSPHVTVRTSHRLSRVLAPAFAPIPGRP